MSLTAPTAPCPYLPGGPTEPLSAVGETRTAKEAASTAQARGDAPSEPRHWSVGGAWAWPAVTRNGWRNQAALPAGRGGKVYVVAVGRRGGRFPLIPVQKYYLTAFFILCRKLCDKSLHIGASSHDCGSLLTSQLVTIDHLNQPRTRHREQSSYLHPRQTFIQSHMRHARCTIVNIPTLKLFNAVIITYGGAGERG